MSPSQYSLQQWMRKDHGLFYFILQEFSINFLSFYEWWSVGDQIRSREIILIVILANSSLTQFFLSPFGPFSSSFHLEVNSNSIGLKQFCICFYLIASLPNVQRGQCEDYLVMGHKIYPWTWIGDWTEWHFSDQSGNTTSRLTFNMHFS